MSAGSSDKDARDCPHRSHSAERWVFVWEIEPWMCWQGLWLGFCSWRTLLPCSPSDADGKSLPSDQTPRLSGASGDYLASGVSDRAGLGAALVRNSGGGRRAVAGDVFR